MKFCTKCQRNLELVEFWKDKSSKDGYQRYCIECNKKRHKEWSTNNPRNRKEYIKKWREQNISKLKVLSKNRNIEFRDFLNNIKITLGCQICNEKDFNCLDFHHIDGKDYNIRHKQGSYKMVLRELKKCCVLCANCHRKVHAKTLTNPIKTIDIEPYLYLSKNGI